MVDEIFDRTYQAGRADLNAGLERGFRRLAETIAKGLGALHRAEWSAPWGRDSRDAGHA